MAGVDVEVENIGEATCEGLSPQISCGARVDCPQGVSVFSGLSPNIKLGITIDVPPAILKLEGIIPYLPIQNDIELFDLNPQNLSPKFKSYVTFKLKSPDREAFMIRSIGAKMNNEIIPIRILRNGDEINVCELEIDTNHLKNGWKKLDISVLVDENSNQFRRYIKIL